MDKSFKLARAWAKTLLLTVDPQKIFLASVTLIWNSKSNVPTVDLLCWEMICYVPETTKL
jgi:hypothetical protein